MRLRDRGTAPRAHRNDAGEAHGRTLGWAFRVPSASAMCINYMTRALSHLCHHDVTCRYTTETVFGGCGRETPEPTRSREGKAAGLRGFREDFELLVLPDEIRKAERLDLTRIALDCLLDLLRIRREQHIRTLRREPGRAVDVEFFGKFARGFERGQGVRCPFLGRREAHAQGVHQLTPLEPPLSRHHPLLYERRLLLCRLQLTQ